MNDDILTCPVCLELDTPSFQCRNGHIVCGGCLDRLTVQPERLRVCPTCRVKYGSERIRCLVAEAFIESRRLESEHGGTGADPLESIMSSQQQPSQAAASAAAAGVRILRQAERVSRVYQIVADGVGGVEIYDGLGTTSEKRKQKLSYGSFIQIIEVVTIEVVDPPPAAAETSGSNNGIVRSKKRRGLVRGRLDAAMGEGWISIREAGVGGKTFALQIEPATYMITAPSVSVTSGLTLDSARLQGVDGSIRAGECVDIVTLHHMPKQGDRVRGKVATGGWITVLDGQNGRELACPFHRGVYCTVAKSTEITNSVRREVVGMRRLEPGKCLNITNTVYDAEDGCVRGRIKGSSGGGYVSLMDKTDWRVHVQHLPLGAYQIQQVHGEFLPVAHSADGGSSESGGGAIRLKPVPAGSYVEVVETTYIDKENVVRGRVIAGGWINLMDTAAGIVYASPVPLGVYITTDVSIVVETQPCVAGASSNENDGEQTPALSGGGESPRNLTTQREESAAKHLTNINHKICRKLKQYATIEVTECHFLKTQKVVRARLATGGFITLIDSEGGRAKPIKVGPYKTTRDYSVVHRGVKMEKGTEVQRIPANRMIDVVETRYLERDRHIRGRLASGGWISLVNVKDNDRYAEKVVERRRSLAPVGSLSRSAAATAATIVAGHDVGNNQNGCNAGKDAADLSAANARLKRRENYRRESL